MPARAAGRSVPVVGASVRCRWTECRVHCGQGAIAARAERPTDSQTRQRPADLRFCRLARAHIVMRESRHAAQAEDLALHPGNGWRNVPQNARHQATALERSRSQDQADHRAGSVIVRSHLRLALRITEAREQRISAKSPKTAISLDISKQRRRENRGASRHRFRPSKIYRRLPKSR